MTRTLRLRVALVAALTLFVVLTVAGAGGAGAVQGSAKKAKAQAAAAPTKKAILFAADGMRPDLVDRYAGEGFLPTMQALMRDGVKGQNGLLQGFPPNTGVGWHQ